MVEFISKWVENIVGKGDNQSLHNIFTRFMFFKSLKLRLTYLKGLMIVLLLAISGKPSLDPSILTIFQQYSNIPQSEREHHQFFNRS